MIVCEREIYIFIDIVMRVNVYGGNLIRFN